MSGSRCRPPGDGSRGDAAPRGPEHGHQPDQRSSSTRSIRSIQEHQDVVREGAQDQGHISHPQPVQPRCHAQVSHCRMLVSIL